MPHLSSIHRIVLGLVGLTVSLLLVAGLTGIVPNPAPQEFQARQSFSESTAVSFMAMASRMDVDDLQATLNRIHSRNSKVLSIGVRQAAGNLVLNSGPHQTRWKNEGPGSLWETVVPVTSNGQKWGQVEVRWNRPAIPVLAGIQLRPDVVLAVSMALGAFVVFSLYLRKVMQHVNPGKVVPTRVRDALNSLAEGLLILDRKRRIVLANESFARAAGADPQKLIGSGPEQFAFQLTGDGHDGEMPWDKTTRLAKPVKGVLLTTGSGEDQRTWSVSTVPVTDNKEVSHGVLASFEDVTQLQKKQQELRNALTSLKASTDEVRKQNRELEWLATRDTLTGCLNRRSFFRDFEDHWQKAHSESLPMSAMMVDIDHFKSINDNHGHSMGDEVLRVVSHTVMDTVDSDDLVCRYGGEEFTVLLPNTTIDEAEVRAEKCRLAIQALVFEKLKVTASLGVSALCQVPGTPQDLLDQADKCLYVAKRNGRNQVVRWDNAQEQVERLADEKAPTREEEQQKKEASAIPFHAVAALTSALAHRDHGTAVHSRRVADMCVASAEGLLSLRECYALEIAALLHDIGKIGVPDSILRSPGRLTPEQLEVVHQYNRIGVDMVRGSFGSDVLTEIVEQHVVHFDMSNCERGAGPGRKPSVAARILAISNAFDIMTSEVSHRRQMTRSEAFAELRRCAGTQFDPELVERFIGVVKLRHHDQPATEGHASRESALSIGLLLEHLIAALDDNDREKLTDITNTLQITATTHGLTEIARLSRTLNETSENGSDEIELMHIAGQLLDLCRSTQSTLLQAASDHTESVSPA